VKIRLNYPIGPNGEKPYSRDVWLWNPVWWLNQGNDKVWQEVEYVQDRPSKKKEYEDNVESNSALFHKCESARTLKGVSCGEDLLRIVCPGPSIQSAEKELKCVQGRIMAVNRAVRIIDPDFIVWTERTADAREIWGDISQDVIVITTPHANPSSFSPLLCQNNLTCVYNIGSCDGIGKIIRKKWAELCSKKQKLLELPNLQFITQAALMISVYMGFRNIELYGSDFCWYDKDYYFDGGLSHNADKIIDRMKKAGPEGMLEEKWIKWQVKPFAIPDINTGNICYTNPYLLELSQRLRFYIACYRSAGIKIAIKNDRGLLPNKNT